MKPLKLSPSILSCNFANLEAQLKAIESHGADYIHIDVMDGHFVPNISMGPFIVEHCKRISNLPLDVHLMIEKPELHIQSFAKAGADWLTLHIEGNPNIYRTLQEVKELGVHPGIALNPGTPANAILNTLDLVDMVLIMTVNPGFSGQKHLSSMTEKVKAVKTMIQTNGRDIHIEVDGGINKDTLPPMVNAGADVIVAATSIFKHPKSIAAGLSDLRNSIS